MHYLLVRASPEQLRSRARLGVTFSISSQDRRVPLPVPNPVSLCPNHTAHPELVALSFP